MRLNKLEMKEQMRDGVSRAQRSQHEAKIRKQETSRSTKQITKDENRSLGDINTKA